MILIEASHNLEIGVVPAVILEGLDINLRRKLFAKMRGDLGGAVNHTLVLDESTQKADNHGWLGRSIFRGCRWAGRFRFPTGKSGNQDNRKNEGRATDAAHTLPRIIAKNSAAAERNLDTSGQKPPAEPGSDEVD